MISPVGDDNTGKSVLASSQPGLSLTTTAILPSLSTATCVVIAGPEDRYVPREQGILSTNVTFATKSEGGSVQLYFESYNVGFVVRE